MIITIITIIDFYSAVRSQLERRWRQAAAATSSKQWRRNGERGRDPGAEPLVRGSRGRSPPEAERKLNFDNTCLLYTSPSPRD